MGDYAARRLYRWCRPPTSGISTIGPRHGGAIGRGCGESFVQREMSSRLVVVRQVATQDARQPGFVHDDHVIETLASDGTDDPLGVGVLPWGTRGGEKLVDAHATRRGRERGERVVAIVNEIARSGVLRKGFAELLRGPEGRRMRGHCDVSDAAALMGEDDQHEQQSIRDSRHDEEIGGRDLVDMIGEKRPPGLGWRARRRVMYLATVA